MRNMKRLPRTNKIKPYGGTGKSSQVDRSYVLGPPEKEDTAWSGSPYRAYGSTHRSQEKNAIIRAGKKTERQRAKKVIKNEKDDL